MVNDVSKIGGVSAGSPEVRKPSEKAVSNSFSDVLNNVLNDAARIQDETAQSIKMVPNVGIDNLKVEMAKAGDAMNRIMHARENVLKAYKAMNEAQ